MTVVVEKEREAEKVHRGSVTSCFMSTTAMYVVTAGHDRRLVAMDAVSMKTAHVWLSEAAPIIQFELRLARRSSADAQHILYL